MEEKIILNSDIEDLKIQLGKELRKFDKLDEKRIVHMIGTMNMCEKLAKKYNVNIRDCMIAGLFHDVAKYFTDEELVKYCEDNNIEIDEYEKRYTQLLHGKVAADIIDKKYVINEDIKQAIINHTIGREDMTMIEKIVFVSDKCEESRTYEMAEEYRKIAFESLDRAIVMMIDESIKKCLKYNWLLNEKNVECRNYILKFLGE